MTALTQDQQLWINLFAIFGFIFTAFATGGYISNKLEEKERRQRDKYRRHRLKCKYQKQWEDINSVYLSLGWFVHGLDKQNAICNDCEFQSDGRCFCTDDCFEVFVDDTQAVIACSRYKKQECEKGQKNNYSEQRSE